MNGSFRLAITACLLSGLLQALPARAEGGRITFSGAIVVPTCTVPVMAKGTAEVVGSIMDGHSFVCGGRSQAKSHPDASIYRLSVVHLDGAATAGSPLLQYFVDYRASMHATDVQMVTRTYE